MQIYKTTNIINGKFYIGKDTREIPNYLGSGILLNKAIQKYGRENFIKEIIDTADNDEKLCELEIYWISEFRKTSSNMMYNILPGGKGGSIKGRQFTELHKSNISKSKLGENHPNFGKTSGAKDKKWSIESRQKLTDYLLAKGPQSTETIEKRRVSLKGKKTFQPLYSQEGKTNISNSLKKSVKLFTENKDSILKFEKQTQEIISFYIEGLTAVEISNKLGITVQRVRSIIFAAKKQLLK